MRDRGQHKSEKADEVSIADEMYLENKVYPDLAVILMNVQNWIIADITGKIRYMLKTKENFRKQYMLYVKIILEKFRMNGIIAK